MLTKLLAGIYQPSVVFVVILKLEVIFNRGYFAYCSGYHCDFSTSLFYSGYSRLARLGSSVILAWVVWMGWPGTAEWLLGLLFGINMVFGGWSLVNISLRYKDSQ
jgi:hypothetical protein